MEKWLIIHPILGKTNEELLFFGTGGVIRIVPFKYGLSGEPPKIGATLCFENRSSIEVIETIDMLCERLRVNPNEGMITGK